MQQQSPLSSSSSSLMNKNYNMVPFFTLSCSIYSLPTTLKLQSQILQHLQTQVGAKLLRFLSDITIDPAERLQCEFEQCQKNISTHTLFLFLSPNVLTAISNHGETTNHIIGYIINESFYSSFLLMKYDIFGSIWKHISNLSQTDRDSAQDYLYWAGFESLFLDFNACPSSIELHLMILMFEHGYYGEIMGAITSSKICYESLVKIISRLIQYQRNKCNCESNQCVYNAEQPLTLLPEEEKDKYRQLCEYDLIDEENKVLYPLFTLNNNNNNINIIPIDDLLNFTPTFTRLIKHVINLIETHNILRVLSQSGNISRYLSDTDIHASHKDLLTRGLFRVSSGRFGHDQLVTQLCYYLESIYYQYNGYTIDSQSQSSIEEITEFIASAKNKSGVTVQNSVVLIIHQSSD
jgi:hypothetical protein